MKKILPILTITVALFNLLACGGATATPSPTQAAPIRYFDTSNFDVRDVPMRMALESLKSQGYVIEENYLDSHDLIADAFARGDADIAWTNNQKMLTAISKGLDLRIVSQVTGVSAAVIADKSIQTCQDLHGKQIGIPDPTTLAVVLMEQYFKEKCPGVEPQLVFLDENSARLAAMLAGETAAAMMQSEALINLEAEAPGQFYRFLSLAQEFPQVQLEGLYVRQAWAEQNPQVVKDFIKAMLLQHRLVIDNPQRLYDETATRLEQDPETAKAISDAYLVINLWDPNGALSVTSMKSTIDFLTSIEAIPAGLEAEAVTDVSYLNAVLDEIVRK